VEDGDDLLLQLAVEVDQQVAAGDEAHVRERRVLEQAVLGEQDDIAQIPVEPVLVTFAGEETARPILGHVGLDRERIPPFPGHRQRGVVEIGGERLDLADVVARGLLEQEDRDRIGFLAGRAAGNPDAHAVARPLVLEQPRDDDRHELDEGGRVAEEGRDREAPAPRVSSQPQVREGSGDRFHFGTDP
jgi:hypothetical protein